MSVAPGNPLFSAADLESRAQGDLHPAFNVSDLVGLFPGSNTLESLQFARAIRTSAASDQMGR